MLFCLLFCVSAFSQKAQKIDEFSRVGCGVLVSFGDNIVQEWEKTSESQIYLIYYEGNQEYTYLSDKNTNEYKNKWLSPRRGDALNQVKEISLYLTKWRKVPQEKVVIVNGGYTERYKAEIWIVPRNAELPKLTPTLTKEDIKFRRGKPFRVRNCGTIYEGQ